MKKWEMQRRTFLKGAGVSILLPVLDAMTPSMARAATAGAPRLAVIHLPHSIYGGGYDASKNDASRYFAADAPNPDGQGAWRPKTSGAFTGNLPVHLAPLDAYRKQFSIVSNLTCFPGDSAGFSNSHSSCVSAWLTAAYKKQSDVSPDQMSNPPDSIDQFIANAFGYTPGSTIVSSASGGDYSEGPGGHGGYISYNTKLGNSSTVVPKETDPVKLFNRLFGSCKPGSTTTPIPSAMDDKSILDLVMDQISVVQAKVGKDDNIRLDSYLQNIRDLEKQINTTMTTPMGCPTLPKYDPALNGSELDWVAVNRLFVDVMALGMASDIMPIATHMPEVEVGGGVEFWSRVQYYSDFVGIGGNKINLDTKITDIHLETIHNAWNGNVYYIEQYIALTRLSMLFVKRLFDKLGSMPAEPNGNTPLDNSIILAGSSLAEGRHFYHNLPFLIGGGKKYGLNQGQHIAMPAFTGMGDFFYTMLQAMKVPGVNFNGNSKILNGIFTGV